MFVCRGAVVVLFIRVKWKERVLNVVVSPPSNRERRERERERERKKKYRSARG